MFSTHFFYVLLGFIIAAVTLVLYHRYKTGGYDRFFNEILQKAEKEIQELKHTKALEAQKEEYEHQKKLEHRRLQIEKKEQDISYKLNQREKEIKVQAEKNEKLTQELHLKLDTLKAQEDKLSQEREGVLLQKSKLFKSLEETSSLSKAEAEEKLFEKLSLQVKKDCALWQTRYFKEKKASAEKEATSIISQAIHRLASRCTSEATVTMVHLPHEDFKSKIIGREGRNINCLEDILGVNLLVDETPKTVIISATDPWRKAIAKETLEQLVIDGRIHPTKIEEEYQRAKLNVEKKTLQKAEDYALRLGMSDLHPKMIRLLAKMGLMDSLGQNLLDHSYQVALIMGVMASELSLNADLAKRIGFLHDVGKAAPAEMSGTHALIGQKLALKYGETEEVANGVGCHHNEITSMTIEGSLCGAADAISASRPGARNENLQHYVKRIKKLEEIALSFSEIEKAYVLQAGRELRVITIPDKIDDASLTLLAQSLSQKIQKQMNHPGKIKVTVFRQRQVVDFATI